MTLSLFTQKQNPPSLNFIVAGKFAMMHVRGWAFFSHRHLHSFSVATLKLGEEGWYDHAHTNQKWALFLHRPVLFVVIVVVVVDCYCFVVVVVFVCSCFFVVGFFVVCCSFIVSLFACCLFVSFFVIVDNNNKNTNNNNNNYNNDCQVMTMTTITMTNNKKQSSTIQ